MSDRKKHEIRKKAAIRKKKRKAEKLARRKDLEKKRAATIKREIRSSIVQQVVKPTFDRGAWQGGVATTQGVPPTTEQPCSKPRGSGTVRAAKNVLKTGGFNRSAWQPSREQSAPPEPVTPPASIPEKPAGFDKSAWMPKHGS